MGIAMSHNKLVEHTRYVADDARTDAYRRALQQVVDSETVVLDLGAGTGILGLLAAEAGARHVYAVEEGPIASVATQIIEASGFADTVTVIGGSSLTVDLPEQVDVVVCDQLFGVVIEADMPRLLADARQRHLRSGGVMLPSSYSIAAAPVQASFVRHRIDRLRERPAGFDFTALAEATSNTASLHRESDTQQLAERQRVLGPIPSDQLQAVTAQAEFVVGAGTLDGIEVSWTATLFGDISVTNVGPKAIDRAVATLPTAVSTVCEDGDEIGLRLSLRPTLGLIDWTVSHNGAVGPRQSTFFGSLLRNRDLTRVSSGPTNGSAIETVASMISQGEHAAAIEAQVWEQHGADFPSRETAARFVTEAFGLSKHMQSR